MHDAVCRFPRITLLRRWVNREKPDPLRTPTWNSWYGNRWHVSERGGSSARRGDSGQQLPIRFGLGMGKVASGQRGTQQVLIRGFRAAHARALRKRRRADPIQPAACSLRTRTLQVYTAEKAFEKQYNEAIGSVMTILPVGASISFRVPEDLGRGGDYEGNQYDISNQETE
jgi:hypothetical protein